MYFFLNKVEVNYSCKCVLCLVEYKYFYFKYFKIYLNNKILLILFYFFVLFNVGVEEIFCIED